MTMNENDKQAEPVAWMDEFGNVFPLGAQRGPKHLNEPMRPLYTHPAQPVQPAVAVNEHAMNWKPLDAHAQSGRTVLLANLEAESMRDDNNAPFVFSDYWHQYRDNGCWESWNELFDEQPTHYCEIAAAEPPAATINEQLLEALENLALACGRNDGWEDYPQEMKAANAAIRAADAEKAKGGV